jgi:catechol 2,3-dioxygenase
MTQIRPLAQPVRRRPGELGVHSLDRFNFAVPDLAAGRKFYSSFGLDVREAGDALDIHTHGHPHRWGSVVEGPRKKLQFISFGAFEEDLPRFRERLERLRIDRLDPPAGLESNGIWIRDPDGTAIEIRVAEKTSPSMKSSFDNASAGPGVQSAPSRSRVHMVRPRRLAHMLVFTRDIPQAIRFYSEVLGLRLSDRSGDMIAFMHGIHGSDHHMIAFARSNAPGHHHFSWDVGSAPAPCTCSTRASPKAGAWAATCSARTTSTTCRIRGEASANIRRISTTSPPPATGRRGITPRTIPSMRGGRTSPRTSFTITRRKVRAAAS